jgi:hypothetical protein
MGVLEFTLHRKEQLLYLDSTVNEQDAYGIKKSDILVEKV